jgi:hypothetical protein
MLHNLTRWAELINATGRPALIENCHQGAYTPGMQQWQGYIKNASSSSGFTHFLGMFFGMGDATLVPNTSFTACRSHCEALNTSWCVMLCPYFEPIRKHSSNKITGIVYVRHCVDRVGSATKRSFFELSPYVCPEPVLVKSSFIYINGFKRPFFRLAVAG